MPTAAHATKPTAAAKMDAIALLKADHKTVGALFEQYENSEDESAKAEIATQICDELTVHAAIEEEIFYPAAREAADDDDDDQAMLNEAEVEHAGIKRLVEEISEAVEEGETDDMTDAKVKVLCEYVRHHVKEEEEELFPDLQKTDMDMDEVGAQLAARKEELKAEMK